jgi:hypothetical protein
LTLGAHVRQDHLVSASLSPRFQTSTYAQTGARMMSDSTRPRTRAYGLRRTVESVLGLIAMLFLWGLVLAPLWR